MLSLTSSSNHRLVLSVQGGGDAIHAFMSNLLSLPGKGRKQLLHVVVGNKMHKITPNKIRSLKIFSLRGGTPPRAPPQAASVFLVI
jgi:hypothetical protein